MRIKDWPAPQFSNPHSLSPALPVLPSATSCESEIFHDIIFPEHHLPRTPSSPSWCSTLASISRFIRTTGVCTVYLDLFQEVLPPRSNHHHHLTWAIVPEAFSRDLPSLLDASLHLTGSFLSFLSEPLRYLSWVMIVVVMQMPVMVKLT